MYVEQLTVFIENRAGRLEKVTKVLKENGISMLSLSLADASEYGLLRIIVKDHEKAKQVLKDAGFSCMTHKVLAIKLAQTAGSLGDMLSALSEKSIDVEYMYVLFSGEKEACLITKTSDLELAIKAVKDKGFELWCFD